MYCSQGHVHSVLNLRLEEIELYDWIIQEWLVSAYIEVDEVQTKFEAENRPADSEVPQPEAEDSLAQDEEPQAKAEQP